VKIAIAVHGRFHAFDFARALIERGHDVTLFTNYPAFVVARFGIPKFRVRSFLTHGVASRILHRFGFERRSERVERVLHEAFGRWACSQLLKEQWDVTYTWSGVSEAALRRIPRQRTLRLLVRGSAHIRTQARLLSDEQLRTGVPQEQPSKWRVRKEEREYRLADAVIVLSSFCHQTFVDQGFPEDRLGRMVSGTRVAAFSPGPGVVAERSARILSGARLRVLMVGTFSYRKGVHDFARIVRALGTERFEFRFVGSISSEAAELAQSLSDQVEFRERLPQTALPHEYAWADVFLFPTIEDGFPAVLAQAAASALPVLTTPNGAGHDLVRDGETGWILPIRSPERFIERLRWCDHNRETLAAMVRSLEGAYSARDWPVVAGDFEQICARLRDFHAAGGSALRTDRPSFAGSIAFVVHGRFYIFDLARELIRQGVDATVFTNYPGGVAERFGVPTGHVRSFVIHAALTRLAGFAGAQLEPLFHRMFGRWAAGALHERPFQIIQCFSGVALETFRSPSPGVKILVRGSSHIELQSRLLRDEEQRAGVAIDRPSEWRVAREKEEYELADAILVLSTFAFHSFVEAGIPPEKLRLLSLGSDVRHFRPAHDIVEARLRRIRSGQPLRVLTVGSFTFRKGALDLRAAAARGQSSCEFRFVGDLPAETARLRRDSAIHFFSRVPLEKLLDHYEWADLFLFPTIEDGYAVVLAEAQAAGLPILATTNCGAPDIITENENGWIVPIRSPDLLVEKLSWCAANRDELAAMAERVYRSFRPRDWSQVAADFASTCNSLLSPRAAAKAVAIS
jgi:glycosyltransferase involved in cell wall biosynthesis